MVLVFNMQHYNTGTKKEKNVKTRRFCNFYGDLVVMYIFRIAFPLLILIF